VINTGRIILVTSIYEEKQPMLGKLSGVLKTPIKEA
jgi:hypothetical protein